MPDFTGYTYTGTTSAVYQNPFSNLYVSGGSAGGWITTTTPTIDASNLTASHYHGTYSDSLIYDTVIEHYIYEAKNLAARVGKQFVHFVMGADIFSSLRDTGIVPHEAMEKNGVVGYVGGVPIHVSPDDGFKRTMLVVIYEPNSTEPEQYRKGDYVLDADVVWQVSSVDEDGTINLEDTDCRVLTGEHLAHPGRGKSGTIGTMPPIKRSPPPPPTAEDISDLFGDVLPQ